MGLRHRAAASISEMTDAIAIIVSEESGKITYFKQGRLKENISLEKLEEFLIRDLKKI
jgi:DNA integrity scanning protein DisA with diadenylate cyclase activity